MPQVIIDPGHGGHEVHGRSTPFGARAGSAWEKELNLRLAERVAAHLGGDALLTRTGDRNLPLGHRAALARATGARAFVSLHGHARHGGADVYVHPRAATASHQLAAAVQRELGAAYGAAYGAGDLEVGELAILHPESLGAATAACLVECGYPGDAAWLLRDPSGLDRMGGAIARGVRNFLGEGAGYGRTAARALVHPGSYTIPGPAIVPLQQPSSRQCWATVFTMMYQWWHRIENQSLDICSTAGTVGAHYASLCSANSVLPWAEIEPFARTAGLIPEQPASYTFDWWVDKLATYGPIWISYTPGDAPTPGITHAVILIGIDTDGTAERSTAHLVDPGVGRIVALPWSSFQTRYENRLHVVGHAWPQVFHWPQRVGGAAGWRAPGSAAAGAYRQPYGQGVTDQWVVWCEDERAAVSPVLPTQEAAVREAELHATTHRHRAFAASIPTEPVRLGQPRPGAAPFGQPVTTLPEMTVRQIRRVGFDLSMAMNGNRDGTTIHVPPPVPPEGPTASLGVHGTVTNESGAPVELICELEQQVLNAPVVRRTLTLMANQVLDFDFDLGTVTRNTSYRVTMRTSTTDYSIRVTGTYNVIVAG